MHCESTKNTKSLFLGVSAFAMRAGVAVGLCVNEHEMFFFGKDAE
jgi:hypothetical protein